MNYIVGDIGNTCTKISILNHKFKIKKSYNIDTIKLLKKLRKLVLKLAFFKL